MTVLHEEGHALGLGHAGPYNGSNTSSQQFSPYDTRLWSIMSYFNNATDPGGGLAGASSRYPQYPLTNTTNWNGYYPTTPMIADIMAIQQIYGAPTSTPLSGGQVFGFDCNITGNLQPFFDFSINTNPVITLWDGGGNNTLDLSGFSAGSTVSLVAGSLSSCDGMTDNLAIAFGTAINNFVGGSGADTVMANDNGDTLSGGSGNDTLNGGAGSDTLNGEFGNIIIKGGSGDDTVTSTSGVDGIDGGAGNDKLILARSTTIAALNFTFTPGAAGLTALSDGSIFQNIESLNMGLLGGSGDDTITIILDPLHDYTEFLTLGGGYDTVTVDLSSFTADLCMDSTSGSGNGEDIHLPNRTGHYTGYGGVAFSNYSSILGMQYVEAFHIIGGSDTTSSKAKTMPTSSKAAAAWIRSGATEAMMC